MTQLATVRKAIAGQGLAWKAAMTPIARAFEAGELAPGGFGFAPRGREPGGGGRRQKTQAFANAACVPLPPAKDWRSVDGTSWVTPVRDQGRCGSCVAFATCAVLESRMAIREAKAQAAPTLSVADLFFCGAGQNGCEEGWQPGQALHRCREHGVGLEKDFHYRGKQTPCKGIVPVVRVPRWAKVVDSESRREAICNRGPVIGCMAVYRDFLYYESGVYRPTTSETVGLHAVAVVGYDDDAGCWILKNSWSEEWGEQGFGHVGYGTCGIDAQYPFYDPEVEPVTPPRPRNVPARKGKPRRSA